MGGKFVIDGDMDAATMREQRAHFEELASRREDIVVDMSKVEFMDSSGVGGVVFLYKRLLANGNTLQLRGAKGQPLQLLNHLRLTNLIAR